MRPFSPKKRGKREVELSPLATEVPSSIGGGNKSRVEDGCARMAKGLNYARRSESLIQMGRK